MVNWIILVALVVLLFIFFKAKRVQHKIYIFLILILMIFFFTTASKIVDENKLDIKSFDGMVLAGKLYFNWLTQVFSNAKSLTGDAIKMNWIGNTTLK